jgi:hypothetical protein
VTSHRGVNGAQVSEINGNYDNLAVGQSRTTNGVNVKLASGELKDGAFLINSTNFMANLAAPDASYQQPVFKLTPYNVPAGKTGATVNYSITLYSPLVLSFSQSDRLSTLPLGQGVKFDLQASGMKANSGWVAPEHGGLLAIDLNGNGQIDNGAELFGEATKLGNGERAANGFEALAQHDLNNDGRIDANDPVFSKLKIWFDLNLDGRSQARELVSLSEVGVTSISLEYSEVDDSQQFDNGNRVLFKAKFHGPEVCGSEGCSVFDVFFNNALIH